MLSQVSPAVSPVSTAAAPREQLAIIPLSIVRALSGTCTRSAVLTYCALAAHADRDGRCWPGRARLGDIAGLSERQVSCATAELERKGLLRKESLPGGRVDYYLAPLTPGTAPPDTGVTPPLTPASPRTDQGTEKPTESAREPEPEPPPPPAREPEPSPSLSECHLQTRTALPDEWTAPDEWLKWAAEQRPELADTLGEIAENFADYHRSKGTRSACWTAEWRRWVRRERAPRRLQERLQGAQTPKPTERRYPTLEQQKAPLPRAMQAAIEASQQRFREQCWQMGIDPDTGSRVARADRREEDGPPTREPGLNRA
jgi:hypothetical protein